jgi:hypothetical protein
MFAAWKTLPYQERTAANSLVKMDAEDAARWGVGNPSDPRENIRGLARAVADSLAVHGGAYGRVIDSLNLDEKTARYLRITFERGSTPVLQEM